MYNETYRGEKEITGMHLTIDNASDGRLTPPETVEAVETPTAFESMLAAATTADERAMLKLIDKLLDESWRFSTGKALRSELRRMWSAGGRSTPRYYTAFHALAERRVMG